jgi:predicted small lipoprotein YifL
MVKIMINKLNNNFYILLILIFLALNSCGKRGAIERPPLDNNLEPAIVEENK